MYKELGDGHLISDKIENEEVFPVGGTFRGQNNIYMIADFDSFDSLFDSIKKNAEGLMKNEPVKSWYNGVKSDLDFPLFCHMMAFNNVVNKVYPDIIDSRKHLEFYDVQEAKKLSDVVAHKSCACAEFSVLAQEYFQRQNISTRYVSGEVVKNNDLEDFEAHSFIVLSDKDKKYIYDPVNMMRFANGSILPRISQVVDSEDKFYVATKNIFNKAKWFYSGGEKTEFLKDLPTKTSSALKGMIDKTSGRG